MDKRTDTPCQVRTSNSQTRFRSIQILIAGLLVLLTSLPADASSKNRLKRPADGSGEPTLQMQTPTLEPTNTPGKSGQFDLRLRKSVIDGGVGDGVLESGTAAETAVPNVTLKLEGGVTQVELQKLAKYDVAVLLDRSHSMTGMDCPPYSARDARGRNFGIPRWEWCRQQTRSLASLTGMAGRDLTITTFYSTFQTFRNVTIRNVERIFAEQAPNQETGTVLGAALAATLDEYFRKRDSSPRGSVNPLAIAIVTDGGVRSSMIEGVLMDATKRMREQDEVHVTMLLIGSRGPNKKASAGIWYLDESLRRYGARYDIVNVVPFAVLERMGLPKALIQALP